MNPRTLLILASAWLMLAGCNRNMEPYVPGEQPQQPDLSKILPAGAERSAGGAPAPMGGRGVPAAAGEPQPITGVVQVAPELAERAPDTGVLFVIARTGAAGPPTAVKRIASPSFPVEFSIGPADRMIRSLPFDGPFQVTARLDADGDAMTRQPGDLHGKVPEPVAPGAQGLTLTLDQVQ